MDIFSFPVLVVAIEAKFPLFHQFKFMFPDFVMAPGTTVLCGEMHFFQLFKFRMTLRGGAVVTIQR
jgi:hypothetical protein